jgi:hypothetical protein
VHLDTGVRPLGPSDATIYGSWGGHNAVDAVKKDDEWKGIEWPDAWKTHMSKARRGFFHHALPYPGGGGQTGPGFAASYNQNSASNAAHETGHSLGLGHSGPYGLDVDVNCKPNYPSLMNYAPDPVLGFSDGSTAYATSLNNWELKETDAVNPGQTAFIARLQNVFDYYVDPHDGNVDWNRDGRFAPAGETVRAYANFQPGGSCEYTRWNKSPVVFVTSTLAPALARLDGRLRAFFVDRRGRLSWSTSSKSSWNCPKPKKDGCDDAGWGLPSVLFDRQVAGVDAIRLLDREALLVVATDEAGGVWSRVIRPDDKGSWQRIPGPATTGSPSLARVNLATMLVTRDKGGSYRYRIREESGRWEGSNLFVSMNGKILRAKDDSTFTPAVIEAPLTWHGRSRGVFALLADEDDDLVDLWYWNTARRRFEKTSLLEERIGPVSGRPALAVANSRLYVAFRQRTSHIARLLMSYTKVESDGSRRQLVGLLSDFDNSWATIQGADLLFEQGIDTNLRALLTHGKERKTAYQLWFYPKADGIQDYRYVNYDDWQVLGINLCREVVNPGGAVSNPIKCLPKTW